MLDILGSSEGKAATDGDVAAGLFTAGSSSASLQSPSPSDSGGIISVGQATTAKALQDLIDKAPAGAVISLDAGVFHFDRTIVVGRDDITIRGAGSDKTVIEVASGLGQSAFRIGDGATSGDFTLGASVAMGDTKLVLSGTHSLKAGDFVYLSRANTDAFFDEIGDTAWRKGESALRTSIVEVKSVAGGVVTLTSGVHFDFVPGETKVSEMSMATGVAVGGFTVDYGLGKANPSDFSNRLGAYDRDAVIQVEGTAGLRLTDITARDVPSLGVNVALSRDAHVDDIEMTGAHNKGAGGNGYALQIRDVYDSAFTHLSDLDMRHSVVFASWRSAVGNLVQVDSTDRDINFHGGRHHDNVVMVNRSIRDANSDIIAPTIFYNKLGTDYGAPTDPSTNKARFGEVMGTRLGDDIKGYDNGAWLDGAGGHDTLTGGAGIDVLKGGAGDDILMGGAGVDMALYDGKRADFTLNDAGKGWLTVDDTRSGGGEDAVEGVEWLVFDDGALRLSDMAFKGLAAIEGMFKGPGHFNPAPVASLPAPVKPPVVVPPTGAPLVLEGTSGRDTFEVSQEGTVVNGREGRDLVRSTVDFVMSADVERLVLLGARAIDGTGNALDNTITGNAEANAIRGADGRDKLYGGFGDDILDGGAGNDTIDGGDGSDIIIGGIGNDRIVGGLGDDRIDAGAGVDRMSGNGGADLFMFLRATDSIKGQRDTILDFASGVDVIDLRSIDADTMVAGDQAFAWNGTGAGRLIFKGGLLWGDTNGDGVSDFEVSLGSALLAQGDLVL